MWCNTATIDYHEYRQTMLLFPLGHVAQTDSLNHRQKAVYVSQFYIWHLTFSLVSMNFISFSPFFMAKNSSSATRVMIYKPNTTAEGLYFYKSVYIYFCHSLN